MCAMLQLNCHPLTMNRMWWTRVLHDFEILLELLKLVLIQWPSHVEDRGRIRISESSSDKNASR